MKPWWAIGTLIVCLVPVGGCGSRSGPGAVRVERTDLVMTVEATGSLRAVESTDIIPPPIASFWRYKISHMVPESSEVTRGQTILSFDVSDLKKELEQKVSERDQTRKEMDKKKIDLQIRTLELAEKLIRAGIELHKAERKVDVPESLTSRLELRMAVLDRDHYRREVELLQSQREYLQRSAEAQLETLVRRHQRADQRVRQLEKGIRSMTVTAPRDGLVIFVSNWRGDKRKIGDTVSRFEKILQLPDLARMEAEGNISEVDAGLVVAGQAVQLRLDTEPGMAFPGRVDRVAPTVRRESRQSARKVYRVVLSLDRTDRERMRPGMRVRADIEVDRVADVLVLPLEAVFPHPDGPVVLLKQGGGRICRAVVLGTRNRTHVEIRSGVSAGDVISLEDPGSEACPSGGGI